MIVVRPIKAHDYDDLYQIAIESGHGFTSLPVNEKILKQRITLAHQSFIKDVECAGDESYLFVLEDTKTQKIVGTSGIEAAVGLSNAFYHYRLGKVVHHSRELNIYNTIDTLSLCNDYTGSTELCTLFLSKNYRQNKNGALLSRSRFLFMAEHPKRFSTTVIAEMRGISDENGRSPFWAWLEEHFFSIDFPTADYLTGIGKKVFIAELMPKYPIYVNLLSEQAQKVIGQVHKKTEPALKLLEKEGFTARGYVDIFDAGPTVEANINSIKTVVKSQLYQVTIQALTTTNYLFICNQEVENFRATYTAAAINQEQQIITINEEAAHALNVQENSWVRIIK